METNPSDIIFIATRDQRQPLTLFEHLKEWAKSFSSPSNEQPQHPFDSNARSFIVYDEVNDALDLIDRRNALKGEGIKLSEVVEYINAIIEHPLMNRDHWLAFSCLVTSGFFLIGFYRSRGRTLFDKVMKGIESSVPGMVIIVSVYLAFLC